MVDLKRMQSEIDEMEKALEEPSAGEEEFHTDAPGTDAPGTSAPGTEVPGTEVPGTDAPLTEAPKTEAPTTEAPTEDPRDKELRELREKVEALSRGPEPTKAPSTKAPSTDAPITEEDFLGDIDLDDLTRDKDLFNKVLNMVHKKGLEAGMAYTRSTGENLVRSIPDITKNALSIEKELAEAHDAFYEENKDLIPWKRAVAAVFEEVMAKDPGKGYKDILPDVAAEVRKRLNIKKKADDKGDKGNPPKLPKKKGGQRQTTNQDLNKLDKEMDEMDKALGL